MFIMCMLLLCLLHYVSITVNLGERQNPKRVWCTFIMNLYRRLLSSIYIEEAMSCLTCESRIARSPFLHPVPYKGYLRAPFSTLSVFS
jgi:hypothetical protein